MHKIVSIISGLSLLLSSSVATLSANLFPTVHTVCVDPGHGGSDPGAMNADLTEAEVNLNTANKLKILLENNHYKVIMTRNDNSTSLSNSDRAEICNQNHADMALAIHLNSSTDDSVNYTQGLYGSKEKDKQLTDLLHQSLLKELNLPNPPNDDPTTDFNDNFLMKTTMPATLQETVFISSSDEYQQLESDQRQQQIAKALFDGIATWFNQKNQSK